jgi:hypothetical protein
MSSWVKSSRLTAKSSAGDGNPARTAATGMGSTKEVASSGVGGENCKTLIIHPV